MSNKHNYSTPDNPRLEFALEIRLRFQPDKPLALDARYLPQEKDGTLILLQNKGFIWRRHDDTLQKLYDYAFNEGPGVPHQEYYFRTVPTFEVPAGRHDWLNNHIFIGIGERLKDGNRIRYYAVM
jgi:hypothetical protein